MVKELASDNSVVEDDLHKLANLSEAEISAATGVFSFELEGLGNRLKEGGDWQKIVQGHLFFDHVITKTLAEAMARPRECNFDRMSFALKLDLASAMGLIPPDMKPFLVRLNRLRNNIAHDLEFVVDDESALSLRRACGKLIGEEVDRLMTEGRGRTLVYSSLLVNIIHLDIVRQSHNAHRLKQRKSYAMLKKALDRVSQERPELYNNGR